MGILGYVTGKSKQSWHLHIKAGAVKSKNQGEGEKPYEVLRTTVAHCPELDVLSS